MRIKEFHVLCKRDTDDNTLKAFFAHRYTKLKEIKLACSEKTW